VFRSASTSGPWEFVHADQLPQAFKDIAPGSDLGGVRSSVAGTEEAEDALLDMDIPQTSAIKRDEAKFDAQYDGGPRFEQIPGTSVKYASNTGQPIIEVGGKYYAADNGVWFVANSPSGPWTVADQVPEEQIQQIPPSSAVYNVTHLHVDQSTPQVLYVGYTPGYMWSFPYYGVPVYGTGFYYPPYYGSYYYPRWARQQQPAAARQPVQPAREPRAQRGQGDGDEQPQGPPRHRARQQRLRRPRRQRGPEDEGRLAGPQRRMGEAAGGRPPPEDRQQGRQSSDGDGDDARAAAAGQRPETGQPPERRSEFARSRGGLASARHEP